MSAYGQSMVTDGRRLLVIESVVGTGPVVAAYDARDGRRVWEAPSRSPCRASPWSTTGCSPSAASGVVAFGTG